MNLKFLQSAQSLRRLVFIIPAILLISACIDDASRDNPLDPANGLKHLKLTGRVMTFYHPREALPNANIHIQPGNFIAVTDENGIYHIPDLEPGSYQVICKLPGYHSDSTMIDLTAGLEQDFFLDGLPEFRRITVRAHHLSRWFPGEEFYFLSLEADVNDPDGLGDIHSVLFTIPTMSFIDTLLPAISAGIFTGSLFDSDLPVTSIHELIGHELFFHVRDDFGTKTASGGHYVTRIIEQTPILVAPIELNTIEILPMTFEWQRVFVPYPATLRIEIFQINFGIALKIDELGQIPLNTKNIQYEKTLNPGDYFWTLHIVDEFGNSSGSKEGTFRIQ